MAHQIAVFAENKPGRIERVSRILGEAGVNIRAITIATADAFGVIKLLVDDPAKAYARARRRRRLRSSSARSSPSSWTTAPAGCSRRPRR